jgi:hypothetical protein
MHCTNFDKKHPTHIHGTDVPVEEPSTASTRDSCTAANLGRFDKLGRVIKPRVDLLAQ